MSTFPIHECIATRSLFLLRNRLRKGADVNKRDESGCTPLHFAIKTMKNPSERYEVCKLLLDHKAEVNSLNKCNSTPLYYLIDERFGGKVKDNEKLLDLLIRNGADVNYKSHENNDKDNYSPLFKAVYADNLKAAKKLLESGAKLTEEKDGVILNVAVLNESIIMFKLLLRYNAKINDCYLLRSAAFSSNREFIDIIVNYCDNMDEKIDYFKISLDDTLCKSFLSKHINALEILMQNLGNIKVSIYLFHEFMFRKGSTRIGANIIHNKFLNEVKKHIAIIVESSKIDKNTQSNIGLNTSILKQLTRYREQLRRMKNSFVLTNSRITYFDLLTTGAKVISNYYLGETFVGMSELQLKEVYPDFADYLIRDIQKVISREIFWRDYRKYLYETFNRILTLDLIHYILKYLQIEDLQAYRLGDVDSQIENLI